MKKFFITILVLLLSVNFNYIGVNAEERQNYTNKYLNDIEEIIPGDNLVINGVNTSLFVEFRDQKQAIKKLKGKIPLFLLEIRQHAKLTELNESNWRDYRIGMYNYLSAVNDYGNYNEDISILNSFFDIFENKYINDEIIEIANLYKKNNLNCYEEELVRSLPYYSEYCVEYRKNNLTNRAGGSYDRTAAINYALTYATSRNTPTYHYSYTGDCANFVSQIFEAAGLTQSSGSNVDYGWWHHYSNGTHTHSKAWSYAHYLAVYFNVVYSCSTIFSFTNNISAGDAIVIDYTNDGDWDHAGFVVNKSTTALNGYYDCRIAQHTTDYCEWISSSKNGWENYSGNGKYGRIRA